MELSVNTFADIAEKGGGFKSLGGNRSGCENRAHAADCAFSALAGSRDGAASPRRAASHASVRYAKTLRCCCCNVMTTVIMLSTKREPSSLCVPKLPLRHSTPGRSDLSAALFVGSTPSTCTKVHNASRRFRMSRHVPAVLGTPPRLPASNNRSTSRRSGLIEARNVERCTVPSRTRCHHVHIWCACASKASPSSAEAPHGRASLRNPAANAPSTTDATAPGTSCSHSTDPSPGCRKTSLPTARGLPAHRVTAAPKTPSQGSSPPPITTRACRPDAHWSHRGGPPLARARRCGLPPRA